MSQLRYHCMPLNSLYDAHAHVAENFRKRIACDSVTQSFTRGAKRQLSFLTHLQTYSHVFVHCSGVEFIVRNIKVEQFSK